MRDGTVEHFPALQEGVVRGQPGEPVGDEAAPLLRVVREGLAVAMLGLHAHARALLLWVAIQLVF